MLNEPVLAILEGTLEELGTRGRRKTMARFQEALCGEHPELGSLFQAVDPEGSGERLAAGLGEVVRWLRAPETLQAELGALIARHPECVALAARGASLAETLARVLAEHFGDSWNSRAEDAWQQAAKAAAEAVLLVGSRPEPPPSPESAPPATGSGEAGEDGESLERVGPLAFLRTTPTAVLLLDSDLRVAHANPAAREVFGPQDGAAERWLAATPALRKALGDPAALPFEESLSVGERPFTVRATPVLSESGHHLGFCVECSRLPLASESPGATIAFLDRELAATAAETPAEEPVEEPDGGQLARLAAAAGELAWRVEEELRVARATAEGWPDAFGDVRRLLEDVEELSLRIESVGFHAAVEATRIGEHGDAFAVVAGEVRDLARRSREAIGELGRRLHERQVELDDAALGLGDAQDDAVELTRLGADLADLAAELLRDGEGARRAPAPAEPAAAWAQR